MVKTEAIQSLLEALSTQGYACIPDFLPDTLVQTLRTEQLQLLAQNQARPAAIGRDQERRVNSAIRNDIIRWLHPQQLSLAQESYWHAMHQLREALNRHFYLGLHTYECHFACYPPGGYYARHRDAFRPHQFNVHSKPAPQRVISTVFYLNANDWRATDGGALRLYLEPTSAEIGEDKKSLDILPLGGQLVLFKSQELEHEVLPSERFRYSLTGWLKTG